MHNNNIISVKASLRKKLKIAAKLLCMMHLPIHAEQFLELVYKTTIL